MFKTLLASIFILTIITVEVSQTSRVEDRLSSAPLYSNYQAFGLVIGQGNYGDPASGGPAPFSGAEVSAQLVADNLGRINNAGRDRNITLIVTGDTGRITKAELVTRIDTFIEQRKRKLIQPNGQSCFSTSSDTP